MHTNTTINDAKISSSIHPEELNDLKIIYDKYNIMCDLKNNIDRWQENYVLSFLKDYDEITDYIPQNQIEEYNKNFCKLYKIQLYDNITDDFQETNEYHQHFLRKELLKMQQRSAYGDYKGKDKSKFNKKFIIDTYRKQIIEIELEFIRGLRFNFIYAGKSVLSTNPYYACKYGYQPYGYNNGVNYERVQLYTESKKNNFLCLLGTSKKVYHNRFNYGKASKEENFEIGFNAETNEFAFVNSQINEYH